MIWAEISLTDDEAARKGSGEPVRKDECSAQHLGYRMNYSHELTQSERPHVHLVQVTLYHYHVYLSIPVSPHLSQQVLQLKSPTFSNASFYHVCSILGLFLASASQQTQ